MEQMDNYVGTKPVAPEHQIDLDKLSVWMGANVPGFEGPLSMEMFKGGQSNPTYKLITPKAQYVMRSKPGPVAKLLPSAHAIEREFAVMSGLAGTNVPVPRMYGLCDDESYIGRAFYIMEFKDGRVLWEQTLPGMTNAQRGEIYDQMNLTIANLHKVDYKAQGLGEYGRPGNYFERQISRWSKQYTASITTPIAEMDKLIAWLPEHMPASAKRDDLTSIVHGDFRLDNMMFASNENKVIAVLDWELSTLGHPIADFSYHCMSWRTPHELSRGIGGVDLASLGIPDEQTYIRKYCERTGFFEAEELFKDWDYYIAFNMFRIAAILQGIAKRVEAGTASNENARKSAARARPMAELAWKFAQAAGAK